MTGYSTRQVPVKNTYVHLGAWYQMIPRRQQESMHARAAGFWILNVCCSDWTYRNGTSAIFNYPQFYHEHSRLGHITIPGGMLLQIFHYKKNAQKTAQPSQSTAAKRHISHFSTFTLTRSVSTSRPPQNLRFDAQTHALISKRLGYYIPRCPMYGYVWCIYLHLLLKWPKCW